MDSYMVYETRYRPALQYPLRVTTFTTKELDDIQKPFIYLLLPKIGLNRHMPRDVIYGPTFRGGLGLVNLEEQQIIQHFDSFQGHIRRNDDIGKSLKIQIATQQLEIGSGTMFLNTQYSSYNYGTSNTRLSYLWKQCSRFNIQVTISNPLLLDTINGKNKTIMDYAVEVTRIGDKTKKLALINSCRIYLHLLWPCDLLRDDSEVFIDRRYIYGTHTNPSMGLNYPNQGKPSAYAWSLWKDFIYSSFCIPHTDERGNLQLELVRDCRLHYCDDPVDSDFTSMMRPILGAMSLRERFYRLPVEYKQIVGNVTISDDDGHGIFNALQNGTAVAASDGSYLEESNKGSHAYKIVDKDDMNVFLQGATMCPESDKMSSSPAEHYGALSILIVLIVLLHHHDALHEKLPTMVLYIDNEEVVNRGNNFDMNFLNVNHYLTHDYDLWRLMVHLQMTLKITIQFEWIKGHQQDSDVSVDQLPIELNNQVDALATAVYELNIPIPQRGAYHSGQVCFHQEGFHVQNIAKAISARESDARLLTYYKSKGWTEEALLRVDWTSLDKFLLTQSPIARCNTIQFMYNLKNKR